MIKKQELRKVILECMEFFKEELRWGALTPRQTSDMEKLRDKCYEILGKPSIADCDLIKEQK